MGALAPEAALLLERDTELGMVGRALERAPAGVGKTEILRMRARRRPRDDDVVSAAACVVRSPGLPRASVASGDELHAR